MFPSTGVASISPYDSNTLNNKDTITSSGLFKWTVDALFGKDQSPSKKYKEDQNKGKLNNVKNNNMANNYYSQDDTNNFTKTKDRLNLQRSNSFDSTFYRKYDLLNSDSIEKDENITSNNHFYNYDDLSKLLSPVPLFPPTARANNHKKSNRNNDRFNIIDEDIRHNNTFDFNITNTLTNVPGKFPKPRNGNEFFTENINEFHELFNQLSKNKQMLIQLNERIHLIQDENQSLYNDNIYLRNKYQDLKNITDNMFKINSKFETIEKKQRLELIEKDQKIQELELLINKLNIARDKEIIAKDELINDLSRLKKQNDDYKLEIIDLNNIIRSQDDRYYHQDYEDHHHRYPLRPVSQKYTPAYKDTNYF